MIGWLKYFPLELRTADPKDFRGPDIAKCRALKLIVGGSEISISAPRHSSRRPEPSYHVKSDGLSEPFVSLPARNAVNDNWEIATLLSRSWTYQYAWFAGEAGELYMSASVVRRAEGKRFDGPSLFHPSTFVYAISNYMDTMYGHKANSKGAMYTAPVNWTVLHQLPVDSARYDLTGSNESLFYVFPVTDECFFELRFSYRGLGESLRDNMERVAHHIVSTVEVELSPKAQSQLDAVKAQCADISLPKELAPLKWPIKPEDIGKGEILKPEEPHNDIFSDYDRIWPN